MTAKRLSDAWARALMTNGRRIGVTVRHAWRSSLQARVAVTTLVISGLVAVLLGFVLLNQITSTTQLSAQASWYSMMDVPLTINTTIPLN